MFKFDTKSFIKSLEKQTQEVVKNHKLSIQCPECNSTLGDFNLKALNKNNELYCKKCEKKVVVNLDKVDKKFK